ncbi:LacI family DNA-binding transcriptional regulator [Phytoactinopolyspora halotolerans]|uniref:LacI family transcriptional regulator n=1 Tax=Phytoactinopolyspora halotolerans TaxID=1981512 RepID=A0A6L9S380_9ACTN|nr:LacI family DNA-binding transcriptional regulator [Phytoactinopolyspora halotolerans]NED99021.1 LacI family transcriptional regulator [Phytoactinopolyspora halotolerans]
MTGIIDVAARAGVSATTVSRALRGLPGVSDTRRRMIRDIAAEMGYVASPSAAGLPTGRTGAVGVVSPPVASGWYFTAIAEGVQEVISGAGYDVLRYGLTHIETERRHAVDTQLLRKRVDGLVVLSLPLTPDEVNALVTMQRPVIAVGPVMPGISTVRIDDVEVGRTAVRHLVNLGHRRIGFAGGDPGHSLGFPVAPDRQQGYEEVLREAGIEPDPKLVAPAKFIAEAGVQAYAEFKRRGPLPTAIFAVSDEVAMGVVHAARADGVRMPEDLSVVGVDDHDLAWVFGLTTVAQPVREQGRIAADSLLERMRTFGTATYPGVEVTTMPTELIIRSSTAPPRAAAHR